MSLEQGKDLRGEAWRSYQWDVYDRDLDGNEQRRFCAHTITDPKELWVGATTHRVLDADGVVHCVPAPGERGCVLRWKPRDAAKPVQF